MGKDLRDRITRQIESINSDKIADLWVNMNKELKKLIDSDKLFDALEISQKYQNEIDYFDIKDGLFLDSLDILRMFNYYSERDISKRKMLTENALDSFNEKRAKYLGWILNTYYKNILEKELEKDINEENYESASILKKYALNQIKIPQNKG